MTAVFWCLLAVLLIGSLAGLMRPFLRRSVALQGPSPDLAVYQRQQSEIAADLAAGLLDEAAAEDARAEIARRALRFEAQAAATTPVETTRRGRRAAIAGLALVVPVATLSLYLTLGQPTALAPQPAMAAGGEPASPHTSAQLAVSATQLAERLARDPQDANGWVLLGRTYAALDRYGDAADAFAKAIALVPNEPSLHAQRGETLALGAEGMVTEAAAAEFKQAGDDPRARFYLAAQSAQAGRNDEAIDRLQKLLADAPADANWRSMVVDALDELGIHDAGTAPVQTATAPALPVPPPAAAPRGPSADQMAAAAQMAPGDRETMIRGMVAGLAARLEADSSDTAGWARLATAYDVLGEKDKAADARAHAAGSGPVAAAPLAAAPAAPTGNPLEAKARTLAARLETQPSDVQGWLDLARTYRGLGREPDAMATLKRANQKLPGTEALLVAYSDGLSKAIQNEKLPPEFVEIMTQINAIDADQPDALWYLGLAAEQRGDAHRARTYWTRLAARLPDGDERKSIRQRLAKLR
ncbi:MAG: ccmI [Rhodospirillales bacterium]|nr:ccmI [Rhodospirillales bacterium]